MKITKLASSDTERTRFRGKFKQLLSKAEDIKQAAQWTPSVSKDVLLKAPLSRRQISRREEVILLEGSKLHGFKFPPWTNNPDNSLFDNPDETSFYTYIFLIIVLRSFLISHSESADLNLSDAQKAIFAGWKRPHESLGILTNEDITISIDEMDLVQDITTDCSVVASLCAGTARFRKGRGQVSQLNWGL